MDFLFKKLSEKIYSALAKNVPYYEARGLYIGTVAVFCFPLFFIIWHDTFPQPYENIWLRLLGSLIFIPITLNRYWPPSLSRLKVFYWNLAILYALPFFFTYMLLKNDGSHIWTQSLLIAVFIMILVLDWLSLLVHSIIGIGLACLAYYLSTPQDMLLTMPSWTFVPIVAFAMLIGIATNYSTERTHAERERAMLETAGSMAHELRTPLMGIRAAAAGIRQHLPALLEAYRLAEASRLAVPPIRKAHLHALEGVLERIDKEATYSNTMIDMLIVSTRHARIEESTDLTECSMSACVDEALLRYPFSATERSLVRWQNTDDFYFRGSSLLFVHVLFNLIKNALRHIQQAGKGEIILQISRDQTTGHLMFRDSGSGIAPEVLPHIFDRFYTTQGKTANWGAGIGLAFCRQVVRAQGGEIACRSIQGEFTEFDIALPIRPNRTSHEKR